MAKPTGFMDYKRIENGNVPPLERINNFKEFHPKLDEKAILVKYWYDDNMEMNGVSPISMKQAEEDVQTMID